MDAASSGYVCWKRLIANLATMDFGSQRSREVPPEDLYMRGQEGGVGGPPSCSIGNMAESPTANGLLLLHSVV